jgi:hypothetical protein
MKGNTIILSANPQGKFLEGVAGDTSKPGTIMQIQAGTVDASGRKTYIAAAPGTDGLDVQLAVMIEDDLQGFGVSQAAVVGTRIRLYVPISGEEMNILAGEIAGTGNSYTIGDKLIVDAESGILVPYAATPQAAVAEAMETLAQVAGSTLLYVTIL